MITVTMEGDESYPDIRISDGLKSFLIKRMHAPDPYWIPDFQYSDIDDITFTIEESDGDVYALFEMLYHNVINGNVFPWQDEEMINNSEKDKERRSFQKLAQDTGLVKDNIITWHSEDLDPIEYAAVLTIKKNDEQIDITFSKNKEHKENLFYFPTYAIRISESWSIYQSFFCPFVTLHRQLQALKWEELKENDPKVKFSK